MDRRPELCLGQPGLSGADGLGRLGLPVRHPGHPLVLDRRHSRHALPGPGDDALLLRLKTHSVPGYLDLRYGGARPQRGGVLLRHRDDPHERRQHVRHGRGHEGCPWLGYQLQHLRFVDRRGPLCGPGRSPLGHLQRGAAICAHLGRRVAGAHPGPHQAGGVSGLKRQIMANMQSMSGVSSDSYFHLWRDTGHFAANPMGVHWTGIVFGLGFVISFGYWTTDFLVVQRVLAAHNLRAARMAPIIGSFFKMAVPFIVILPGLLGLVSAESRWQPPSTRRRSSSPGFL